MSDTDIPAEGLPEAAPEAPAETTAADSRPEEQTTTEAEGSKPAETKEDSPAKETVQAAPQQTDSRPKSRHSAEFRINQVILQREAKAREANEWKSRYEAEIAARDGDGAEPQAEDSPDISKTIQAEVDRRMEPVLKHHSNAADETEISELFAGKPDKRAEYEPKIREAWKLDQYRDVAASELLKLFSYDSDVAAAKAAGVEEWKRAQKEAKESSGSGASARTSPKTENAWELSEEDFRKQQDKVRGMAG